MKFIIIFLFVSALSLQGQDIDTTINNIRYQVTQNPLDFQEYSLAVQNNSTEDFRTSPFPINGNKPILYNSSNQKLGYDFTNCGIPRQEIIKPDSSKTWKTNLYDLIPRPRNNSFVMRHPDKGLDSLYFGYWRINGNLIGPVEMFIYPK